MAGIGRQVDAQVPGTSGSDDTTQGTAVAVPPAGAPLLHHLIEAQVARTPAAPAVEMAGRTLTYAALDACANRLARLLVDGGVGPDGVVAVCMERSLELPVVLLAIHKAGGAFLPIDPELPRDRVRFKLEDSACRILLVHGQLIARARDVAEGMPVRCLAVDASAAVAPDDASHVPASPPATAGPSHLAYVMYTSGSTGRPKGVLVPHRAVANHAAWFAGALDITPADRMLQYASISFDAAIAELFAPLVAGATVVLAEPGAQRDLTSMPALFRRERITLVQVVPSALQVIAAAPGFSDCRQLRYLVSGGEALDGALAARCRRELPQLRIGNFYGPTEAAVDATWHEITGVIDEARPVPIGRPIANVSCHILDGLGRPVLPGAEGELYIGGAGVARGYLNLPERTAARFVADPDAPDALMYRTGDMVRRRPDGVIEYLGRSDAQVKLRGYRIELGEVEAPLLADPRVRQAVVVLREDTPGEPALVAYVVPTEPGGVCPRVLRERLRERLPVWMVPSSICVLEALPLTINGKVDRAALPAPAIEDDGDPGAAAPPLDDPIERSLQAIWESTLGVRPIGPDDDFFALGGHSIKALRLLAAVEAAHGVSLRASAFFTAPTIRQQAARLRAPATGTASTVIAVQPRGEAMPVFFAPGGGGELLVLDALARALGPGQPLHVLDLYAFGAEQPGAGVGGRVPRTLHEIAARIVADMRVVQPHGPYRLAGYSLGGNVVYEMAQQLVAAGECVSELALLDCDGPGYPLLQPAPVRAWRHLRHALSLGAAGMPAYLGMRVWNVARGAVGAGRAERALYLDEDPDGEVPLHAVQAVERALAPVVEAWLRYEPRPYAGRVLLIRAAIRRRLVGVIDTDRLLGWGPLLCGPVRVAELPCDHFAMLRAEHAVRLAGILGASACAAAPGR
ncbi:MAG: amino acid adenylation domain-containing protein [Gemmatimonadaceae bacterium]|nr:amino acid adenylation domain-containing protein [Gemmatimonadaceae bacterium]